jgi:serine phosphatase RsbU (regulator of sigma subunit)
MRIGKSILTRIFVYYFFFTVVAAGVLLAIYTGDMKTVPVEYLLYAVIAYIVFWIAVYWMEVVRPFKVIMGEMKSLLAGKRYRKIYTRRTDEVGVIAHFFNEVTKSFEKVTADIKEKKRMLSELEVASSIQRAILPPENPVVPGLDVDAKTRPAVELGGDVFDFITIKDNTFIYVGDVTGHGVPAAIVMTMVNTLIRTLTEFYTNGYDVVVNVNKQLKNRIKSTMFMTMLMYRWNHTDEKMSVVGAGHEHVVVYRAGKGKCDVMKTGGIALGMVPDNSKLIKEIDLPMEKDDVVIMYTDGLTEGRNMSGEMYGLDRLVKAVELYAPQYSSDGIVHHIATDYSRFVENHVQDDDVTLIAMKYVGKGHEEEKSMSGISTATLSWLSKEDTVKAESAQKDAMSGVVNANTDMKAMSGISNSQVQKG